MNRTTKGSPMNLATLFDRQRTELNNNPRGDSQLSALSPTAWEQWRALYKAVTRAQLKANRMERTAAQERFHQARTQHPRDWRGW